jgi:hypothetical protein
MDPVRGPGRVTHRSECPLLAQKQTSPAIQ